MRICFALLWLSSWCAAETPQRDWQLEGAVRTVARSADGRYDLSAQAHQTGAAPSAYRRYVLKAAHVDCDPLSDSLFANGFENP